MVNELTPESKAALADDVVTMVIGTPLPALCKELMVLMMGAIERGESGDARTVLPAIRHLCVGKHLEPRMMEFHHFVPAILSIMNDGARPTVAMDRGTDFR